MGAYARRSQPGGESKGQVRFKLLSLFVIILALALLCSAGLASAQDPGEESCWACHRKPNVNAVAGVEAANALCLDCHQAASISKELEGQVAPLQVEEEDYVQTRHGHVACIQCHSTVAHSPHEEQAALACRDCHRNLSQHIAAGDAHLTVECAACHFEIDSVEPDPESGIVEVGILDEQGQALDRTGHELSRPVPCGRCHFTGNEVGAPSAALPPKGLLCFACHDASPVLYAGNLAIPGSQLRIDWVSAPALLVFCLGLAFASSIWLRGTVRGKAGLSLGQKMSYIVADACRLIFSRRIFTLLKYFILDGILLRRSLRESVSRWVMHGLIVWPFLARCLLGILTWCMAQFWPTALLTETLVNKNAAPVAFLYDLLGLLIIVGALFALLRRALDRQMRSITTAGDVVITSLLGGLFVVGFVVEGARLIVTGAPFEQAIYSIGGYLVSLFLGLLPVNWASIYPYLWWIHAAFAAAFIAYLPFSKFFHIMVSPLLVTISQVAKEKR